MQATGAAALARLFQSLGDITRLRVVRLLATTNEESCLCEMVDSLQEPQYKLSRHINILKQCGLLTAKKEGRWVYHRLVKGQPHLRRLYAMIRALPDNEGVFADDLTRFRSRIDLREGGRCRMGIQTRELATV